MMAPIAPMLASTVLRPIVPQHRAISSMTVTAAR